MIIFPGSKVNLGLRITERLENGYHSLESIFLPIHFSDILEIIPKNDDSPSSFHYSGIKIDGEPINNLIYKAWDLLNKEFALPPIEVYLHKLVPMGAGIGGGSADATAMLKLLNQEFKLQLNDSQLKDHAKKLGADCPFFIANSASYVEGIGDKIQAINIDLSSYHFYLIAPGIHINTAEAFENCIPQKSEVSLAAIINSKDIRLWKDYIFNDFEDYAFKKHPELKRIKEQHYNNGAIYASMTGTGSSIYGIYEKEIPLSEFPSTYRTYYEKL